MRATIAGALMLAVMVATAGSAAAQGQRLDAIWARTTAGQPITLDGVLDETAWQSAESVLIWYGKDAGIPGSGWKEEGGKLAKDSTYAIVKFLVNGNRLYLGATMLDQSVGGSVAFNREDGLLMCIKDHLTATRPAPPVEFFYAWWFPADTVLATTPGITPCFVANNSAWRFAQDTCSKVRTAAQISNWDARTYVHGLSNSDAANDTGYTVEMCWNLDSLGYNVTTPGGDIVEFNLSIYDTDWQWPINLSKFSVNRTWIQSPWGNASWYDELHIYSKPSVTVNSGAVPLIPPEMRIANGSGYLPPTIDGVLNEPVWSAAPSFDMRYNDLALPATYPGVGPWRWGRYQPPVNGNFATIEDGGDATIKTFFKEDTLYLGFDVRDVVVQYYSLFDRWDGFIVNLTDRQKRYSDHNLYTWRASFQVGPSGNLLAQDELQFLRDTLGAVRCALSLNLGTMLDTVGTTADDGYQAEMAIDLTKLGYPHGLGDRWLWLGLNYLDGDSFTPYTDSYGDRVWWFRPYPNDCCPINAYLDVNQGVTGVEGGSVGRPFALLGNAPNPFRSTTVIRYALARAGDVTLQIFDLQGRLVSTRPLGIRQPGEGTASFTSSGLRPGVYLYRLRVLDPETRAEIASLPGKMLLVR